MNYVIIQSGGKQYKASVGTVLDLDKLPVEAGASVTFDNVLLHSVDGVSQVGAPVLTGVTVTAKVLEQFKGKKLRVAKFKAKARYRRVQGFRAHLTKVQIEKIESKEKKA